MSTIGALAVGWRAARDAKRRANAGRTATVRVGAARIVSRITGAAGSIIGLGALVAAAFTVGVGVGLLAAGIGAFVLEWRLAE